MVDLSLHLFFLGVEDIREKQGMPSRVRKTTNFDFSSSGSL